jgi:hypothetical protein
MTTTIAHPTAFDLKDLHRLLGGFTDDELRQIPVVPEGTHLKDGHVYINLRDPARPELRVTGDMKAGPDSRYVAKADVEYRLWNRLIGVTNPERTGEGNV